MMTFALSHVVNLMAKDERCAQSKNGALVLTNQLVTQMRSEQKVVREWVDEQAQQQAEVASMLRNLADAMKLGV